MRLLRPRIASTMLAMSLCAPLPAAGPQWTLEIERLSLGEASLRQVRVSSEPTAPRAGQGIEVRISTLSPTSGTAAYGPFALNCPGDSSTVFESRCRDGSWAITLFDGWPQLTGTVLSARLDGAGFALETRGNFDSLAWTASLTSAQGEFDLSLRLPEQDFTALSFLQTRLPPLAWVAAGRLSGEAALSGGAGTVHQARAGIELSGLDFDSPEGLYAGLGVAASASARLQSAEGGVIDLQGSLESGELLLQDFYRDFSDKGLQLSAVAAIEDEAVDVRRLQLGDGDALHMAGQLRVPLGRETAPAQVLLRELRLEFPLAYKRYLESLAAVFTLDGLDTKGIVSWKGDWAPGTARSGELRFEDLSITDARRGRFSIRGLDGTLRTGAESRLEWQAASFERLDLGSGSAAISLQQESVSLLEPLSIGVFGGSLSLEELAVGFPRGGEPEIQLQAEIQGIEMQQMSAALGWPEFAGTLSGSIPGINWSEGVVEFEGALEFDVFGGDVLLSDLRVERPFGVLPSLAANITADTLDLEQLTRTFEFGRIAGSIDGYVRDLRMLDWRPVQFDAWFGTPADAGRNDISRQAVNHLATIGGGSATALLTGPVLRLFNNFSYRRLGLGCRLQDNVCHIRGIEEKGDAVLLLEGAGIPKISILAYNRAVDWPQLVAELTAVSSGEGVRIGQ